MLTDLFTTAVFLYHVEKLRITLEIRLSLKKTKQKINKTLFDTRKEKVEFNRKKLATEPGSGLRQGDGTKGGVLTCRRPFGFTCQVN